MKVVKEKKICFAHDNGMQELGTEFLPVCKSLLEKYLETDLTNIRTGQLPDKSTVTISELHVTKVDSAYIEAETLQENPVFFYEHIETFVMAVTNPMTTGSNIHVKQDKTIN